MWIPLSKEFDVDIFFQNFLTQSLCTVETPARKHALPFEYKRDEVNNTLADHSERHQEQLDGRFLILFVNEGLCLKQFLKLIL